MSDKPTPDITPNLATSAYHVLQQYCTGQLSDCKGYGFYKQKSDRIGQKGNNMNKVIKWIKMYVGRKVMIRSNGQDIINHINTHWTNQVCPMCGGRAWSVSNKIFELREFNDGNFVLGGPNSSIAPVIPVTCDRCGNTIFINALSTSLIETGNVWKKKEQRRTFNC